MTPIVTRAGAWGAGLLCLAAAPIALLGGACIDRVLDGGVDGGAPGIDGGSPPGLDSATADSSVSTDADAGPPPPLLELGHGESSFIAAPDGTAIEVHQGPQGGFHIYVSLRMANLNPGDPLLPFADPIQPRTRVVASDASGATLADLTLSFAYAPAPAMSGLFELVGWVEQLDICACAVLAGEPLTVSATVTDADGKIGTASRTWTAVESASCSPPVPPCG